jgi:hypothetical protein
LYIYTAKEIVVNANMAIGTADDCPPGLEKKTVYNEIKGKIENAVIITIS